MTNTYVTGLDKTTSKLVIPKPEDSYEMPAPVNITDDLTVTAMLQVSGDAAINSTFAADSGVETGLTITSSVTQSASAGYNGLLVDLTETTIGTGVRNLIEAKHDGLTLFKVQSESGNENKVVVNGNNPSLEIQYAGSPRTAIQNGGMVTGMTGSIWWASGAVHTFARDTQFSRSPTGGNRSYHTSVATSGAIRAFAIEPTYNQTSGTASNTDLLVNRTETAVGSGTQLLADFQVGGVSKFRIDAGGVIRTNTSVDLTVGNMDGAYFLKADATRLSVPDAATIGWSSTSWAHVSTDTGLTRDSAGVVKVTDGSTGFGDVSVGKVFVPRVDNGGGYYVDHLGAQVEMMSLDTANRRVLGSSASNTTTKIFYGGSTGLGDISLVTPSNDVIFSTGVFGAETGRWVGGGTALSGNEYGLKVTPTYNQASGTAANTDLLVNRTETAVGSGAQLLADFQVGGVSKASIDNAGKLNLDPAGVNGVATGLIFGATSTGFYVVDSTEFRLQISGNDRVIWNNTGMKGPNIGSAYILLNEDASATNPTLVPRQSDSNSGVGSATGDAPNMVAGGVEAQRWTESAGAIVSDLTGVATLITGHTIAILPTPALGMIARITDGDAALAWGATAVNSGSGTTPYLVWYNGTNWTILGA